MIDMPRVQQAAQRARVNVLRFDKTGARGIVEVEWTSDVMTQGMDFIETLLRDGVIRDFDMNTIQRNQTTTPDGRRLIRNRIEVIF
jgi:hypothetical protein